MAPWGALDFGDFSDAGRNRARATGFGDTGSTFQVELQSTTHLVFVSHPRAPM